MNVSGGKAASFTVFTARRTYRFGSSIVMFKARLKSSLARSQVRTTASCATAEASDVTARLTATSRAKCEQMLGYRFTDEKLLQEALTIAPPLNKRLAIIGDRVLGLFMSEKWYYWSSKSLGGKEWSKMHYEAFSNESLAGTGFSMGLHEYTLPDPVPVGLRTGKPARNRGLAAREARHRKPMADTIEALVGGVWLDSKFDRDVMSALLNRMGLVHRMIVFPVMATTRPLHHDFFRGKPSSYLPRFFTGVPPEPQHWSPTAVRLSRRDTQGLFVEHELNRLEWKEPPVSAEAQETKAASVRFALRRLLWGTDVAGGARSSRTKVTGPQPDAQLASLQTEAAEQTKHEELEDEEEEVEDEWEEADEEQEKEWDEEFKRLEEAERLEEQKPMTPAQKQRAQKRKLAQKKAKAIKKLRKAMKAQAKERRKQERKERRRQRKKVKREAAKTAAGDEQGKLES